VIRPEWLVVLLTLGAVVRLTRMVTEDVVFRPVRRALINRRSHDGQGDEDWLVYLIHCRWCASIWISAAVCPLVWLWPDRWFVQIPILALSASLLAGLSGRWE
jgi:hypothetical protein